jgi:hypothetical protein
MATVDSEGVSAPAQADPPAPTELDSLRSAVNSVDALSQERFSMIKSAAGLALARLETPEGWQHIDDVVVTLIDIRDKADRYEDYINIAAEEVGCNYVDEEARRRSAARLAAMEEAQ